MRKAKAHAKPIPRQATKPAGGRKPKDLRSALAAVAGRMAHLRPAAEVLTRVRAVPTVFPSVDAATRVGGWPIERVTVVHGPSNDGKTLFAHGLGLSFLQADHFYAFFDAEMTTPITWLEKLMGPWHGHPGFSAIRPQNYEQAVDAMRSWATTIAAAREAGDIPPDTTGLAVVDGLRKLMPKGLLEKLVKESAGEDDDGRARGGGRSRKGKGKPGGVDGMGGRAAQIKAALNAAWLDELVPLLHHTRTGLVLIVREDVQYEKAGQFTRRTITLGGGRAVVYDSSLTARVSKRWLREGEGKEQRVVGEAHDVEFTKTKIAGKQDVVTRGTFHASNGVVVPEGFWRARDLYAVGFEVGALRREGTGPIYTADDGEVLGRGEAAALAALQDAETAQRIEAACRARFTVEG